MSRIAVIGGGLSGLSAAFYVKQKFPGCKVFVIEASSRFGGWIETHKSSNSSFELGPRSVRVASPTSPYLFDLAEKVGLGSDLVPVDSSAVAARNRYVYVHGKLHKLNPKLFQASSPFTKPLFPMLASSFWRDKGLLRKIVEEDMSVDEYFRLHFNDELADIAINSMIRGIFAGDSKTLGVKSVFPHIVQKEIESNGLIRSFIKQALSSSQEESSLESSLHKTAIKDKWSIWGVKGGMERIIDALVDKLLQYKDVSLNLNHTCTAINLRDDQKMNCFVEHHDEKTSLACDHVFLATSSRSCLTLLGSDTNNDKITLQSLLDVPYVDVAVVGLEFKNCRLPVDGFGHLIPSWEIPHVLGVVYDSCIFPDGSTNSEPTLKLTCMTGGAWYHQYCSGMNESDFLQLAKETVKSQLGICSEPSNSYVRIHRECIPQYPIGHQRNVDRLREYISCKRLPVSLIGASFDGVSVNDCVASSFNAVNNINL